MHGAWVEAKNNYEVSFCQVSGFQLEQDRGKDCVWRGLAIELKKGAGTFWLDLVRYSEEMLDVNPDAGSEVVTLFLHRKGDVIRQICAVSAERILKKFGLTRSTATLLVGLHKDLPRGLNAQARLTIADVQQMADFCVPQSEQRAVRPMQRAHVLKHTARSSGWAGELKSLVQRNWTIGQEFTTQDLYRFEKELQARHPENRTVRNSIQGTIQTLRDDGVVEFLAERGHYRRLR